MKKTPGPLAPPVTSLPSLKMTALSYSWNFSFVENFKKMRWENLADIYMTDY